MSNSFDKLSVLDSFIEEVNSYLPDIKADFERLALSPGDMEALEESYRRTHTIGGSASMMGYNALSHVANGMEDILGDAVEGVSPLDPPTIALLQRSLGRLHRLLDGIRKEVDDKAIANEDDDDYSQYQAMMEGAGQQQSAEIPASPAPSISPLPMPPVMPQAPEPYLPAAQSGKFPVPQQGNFPPAQQGSFPAAQQGNFPIAQQGNLPPDFTRQNTLPQPTVDQLQPQQSQQQSQNQIMNSLFSPGAAMPTLDEVLASFRTSPSSNDDFSWPGNTGQFNALTSSSLHEAAPLQQSPMPIQPQRVEPDRSYSPEPPVLPPASDGWGRQDFNLENQPLPIPQPPMLPYSAFDSFGSAPSESNLASALEMLAGTSRKEPAPPSAEIPSSFQPVEPVEPLAAFPERRPTPELHISQELQPFSSGSLVDAADPAQGKLLPALGELYDEADALNTQATSFKNMLAQLKSAAVIVETQRTEFKGFLDGSKDALDRMERWAGKAMGLNLRNSPEQVRRFLPLSVMWVTNTKLKKVLDVMTHITTSGELTEEQMRSTMQQMHESLDNCNTAFQQLQTESASPDFTQNSGWGDWEMSRARDAENLRERVTFERQGDLSALRAEIENQVRYELEQQIREEVLAEQQPITLATRAELERQIREELRRESEANRQLHQRVAGTSTYAGETPEEMEERLYNEIEIKVRRDFLSQIDAGSLSIPRQVEAPQKDTSWSFAGEADAAAEIAPVSPQQIAYSASHAPVSQPLPRPSQAPAASTSSMGADFAEEAAEIFRAEAEEHLQTISMSVASLEKNPNDRDLIQSIRRATHTLKGAAGMMGFQAIADLSHISEDLLDSIMEGTTQITSEALGLILDTAETLDVLINGNNTDYNTDALLQNLRVRYVQLLGDLSHANQTLEDYIDPEEVDSSIMSSMVNDGSHGEINAP
ncbi:MAG TPA: Hpt domain-containing protein, partial [Ktedonobacteraceae bacterium]|nr:Hpt domain-containing protein [Ktedonobacteraceae bacterium]